MQSKFIPLLAILVVLLSGYSSKAHEDSMLVKTLNTEKYLVDAEKGSSFSVSQLRGRYSLGPAEPLIKYQVTTYKITYTTKDQDGNEVTASGAVMVPEGKDSFALFNYNHGTIFPYDEWNAPSNLTDDGETELGKMLASTGFVVVMPDYIGYGSTKKLIHPYCAYDTIAITVIDMLKAVREFTANKGINLKKNKNFIAGWSEGAGVALAVVKQLEEKYPNEFPVTAAAPMAGAYHSTRFADYVITANTSLQFLRSYAWVLQSYNKVYGINKPLNYYFNEPYASTLKNNPTSYTTLDPSTLFTKKFKEDFLNNKIPQLNQALVANDLWNWKPKAKIILCHGENDNYVPLFNSQKVYDEMKAMGADVRLVVYPGKGHTNCIKEYVTTVFLNFSGMK